ncbi:MAG: DUF2393 domain-containing protein [Armatimonadota bacterium]|nr:DUF2393 domain-containing protein [Armatimonadota bacterium]
MKLSPLFVIALASLGTFAAGQALLPTVKAQPVPNADYHVRLDWQKAERTVGGLVIYGRVTNIGRKPLTYTQVTPTLLDRAGKEVFRGSGYLTVSPLLPGQSAEFRDCELTAPNFAKLRMVFHESGCPVLVEANPLVLAASRNGNQRE